MDLSIIVGDTTLYIRVAGLIKTPRGYLFEKSKKEYVRVLGGKIAVNESSYEALKREIFEEIGMCVSNASFLSVIENFYTTATEKVHEICFVYMVEELFDAPIPDEFVEVLEKDIDSVEILPKSIKGIIKGKESAHIVIK